MLSRAAVVKNLLSLTAGEKYLEIGVFDGETFLQIEAKEKIAVDPTIRFDHLLAGPSSTLYGITSDAFFGEHAVNYGLFDVIYIDGLHTLEQTLRDFANAISFLKPGGIILIDDVQPRTYQGSLKSMDLAFCVGDFLQNGDRAWMGDVYRLVYFIETFFQQWSYATITDNEGQLVVWQEARRAVPERSVEEVGRLPFEALVTQRHSLALRPLDDVMLHLRGRR